MKFTEAKKLKPGDLVIHVGNELKALTIANIEVTDQDIFVRCNDQKLYHHTALKVELV